jgi:hypothetical protein
LGSSQIGAEHVVSSALSSAATLLPIGNRLMRAGLVNAMCTGLVAWLVFEIARRLFARQSARVESLALAAAAALLATNNGLWQLEGARLGGAAVSTVLVLASLFLQTSRALGIVRHSLAQGVVLGLLAVESRPVALMCLLVLALRPAALGELPRLASLVLGTIAGVVTVALGLLPSLLALVLHSGRGLRGLAVELPLATRSLGAWAPLEELGLYIALLGIAGAAMGLVRPRWRVIVLPVLSLPVVHAFWGRTETATIAVVAVALLSCLGAQVVLKMLRTSRLPLWRGSTRVLGLLHLSALLMVAEGAREAHERRQVNATSTWSEHALHRLPASSLVLTNTPDAAWRLWAESLATGVRPDVLHVPQALLAHGDLVRDLLKEEPALAPLIRDMALDGRAGEFALSQVADTRPLRVEPDSAWDKRMLSHCVPDGLWFRFAPHELGRSDRKRAQHSAMHATLAVARTAASSLGRDEWTLGRLRHDLIQQAAVAVALHDRQNARALIRRLKRVGEADAAVLKLERQLAEPTSVATVGDLLR